jgi:hypothetical protein
MIYFEDVNFEYDTPVLLNPLDFKQVKKRLLAAISSPKTIF